MRELLIVGIDPGTTVGYAILDIEGNLLILNSSKHLKLNSLISTAIQSGQPLIIGCDVAPPPSFVHKFAVKTGSKLIYPEQDLKVREKKQLTKKFNTQIKNNHQRAALSSALFAYKTIKPLLKKINRVLKKEQKQHLLKKVETLLIKKKIPIKKAITLSEI